MYTRFITTLLAIFSIVCAYQWGLNPSVAASQIYKISSVTNDIKSDSLEMTIYGNTAPAYTVSERFDPYRLIVDIADTELDGSISPENVLPANNLAQLNLSMLADQDPPLNPWCVGLRLSCVRVQPGVLAQAGGPQGRIGIRAHHRKRPIGVVP